jgi:hypothetical protein
MNRNDLEKILAERKKRLEAANRTLENQKAAIERDLQERRRLCRELETLILKYWPDKPYARPGIWKGQRGYDLVVLVEGMQKQDPDCTIKDAIKHLHEIKCPPCDQRPVKSLVTRYHVAKKHWWPTIRRIREIEAELDALDAAAKERGPTMTLDETRDLVNPKKPPAFPR